MTLATIVVPTTGDRGPLLPYSVGSALAQTVTDIEVFVIGDGVDRPTRSTIEQLAKSDNRIRFFDFPKHERRGEPNRHHVLSSEATGEIVCYLTDRDLYFPDHVEEMRRLLEGADLAHTAMVRVLPDETFGNGGVVDWRREEDRRRADLPPASMPLSMVGHTMAAYRRLPFGWRDTPDGVWTDHYMWQQFLAEPWVRVAISRMPTVLYFNRGAHPGWSTERRLDLLERWSPRIATAEAVAELRREIADAQWEQWAVLERAELARTQRPWRRVARRGRRMAGRGRRVADGMLNRIRRLQGERRPSLKAAREPNADERGDTTDG